MEDKSFINLISEENLSKINIDPRIVDSFKRVMKKIQVYFNANGYTSERNYQEYFNEYLLNTDSSKNLSFFINDEPGKIGAAGFYNYVSICIDESLIGKNEKLDATLCHEFIHFLVMKGIFNDLEANKEIRFGGFINEALTEMLTRQMYPNGWAYEPQIRMMKFANLLSNNVNNYSLFLRGRIDAKGYGGSSWNNFVFNTKAYHEKWKKKGFRMKEASVDELYIEAQRKLIESKISVHHISSFNDYVEKINILMERPAPDNEYISKFIESMDKFLITNLGLKNQQLSFILEKKLQEYRECIKYGNAEVYEFEIAGSKIAIDKDRKIYGTTELGYVTFWDPGLGVYEIKYGNEVVKIDMNKIDFENCKKMLEERQQQIAKYFSPTAKFDIKSVEQVSKKEGFLKLEKFTLPSIGTKYNHTIVYVATYNDRIEILNNPTQIGTIDNIKLEQYIGITSLDPKVGAIYSKSLGNIDSGIVFSKYNTETLQEKIISSLALKLTPTLTQEQIEQIIEQYKLSDEYDDEYDLSKKQLQRLAINQYAEIQYDKMTDEEKQALYNETVKLNERFMISTKDGKIDVSLLFGDKNKTAFKGESEVLVDIKGNGLYNEQFELFSKYPVVNKSGNPSIIKINESGDIIFKQNKEIEEKSMEKAEKTPQEIFLEINKELANLRQQYESVVMQIENLMRRNSQTIIPNYQQQLESLIKQRDAINKSISYKTNSQKVYQGIIDNAREQSHKAIIEQVEKMLSIKIKDTFDTGTVVKTDHGMFLKNNLKDKSTLISESRSIVKKLDDLFYDGQLDHQTWNSMKSEIYKEYKLLISNAPVTVKEDYNKTPQQSQDEQPTQDTYSESVEQQIEYDAFDKKYGLDELASYTNKEIGKPIKMKNEEEINEFENDFDNKYELGYAMLNEIIRQQKLVELQNEQRESIENTGRRIR